MRNYASHFPHCYPPTHTRLNLPDSRSESSLSYPPQWQRSQDQTPQMVDDEGSQGGIKTGFERSITLASSICRFPFILTEKQMEDQRDKKIKILTQTTFPAFAPKDEEQYEDWVDLIAPIVTRARLSVELMQEAWLSVATPSFAAKIRMIYPTETHEGLIDAVARKLAWKGSYVDKLETELSQLKRMSDVGDAKLYVENRIARFYRICQRWNTVYSIADRRLVKISLDALPLVLVEDHKRNTRGEPNWDDLWERAEEQEAWMVETYGRLPQPQHSYPAYPAEAEAMTEPGAGDRDMYSAKKRRFGTFVPQQPTTPCPRCGVKGHWANQCSHRTNRCKNCQMIGHIAAACRNIAVKDARGRVETRVESRPSKVTTELRRDRTKLDKVRTTQATIAGIEKQQVAAKAKAAEKRKIKNRGKVYKRAVIEHEEMVAESESEEEATESEYEEEEPGKHRRNIHYAAVAAESSIILRAPITLNGRQEIGVVDTGASRSIVNIETANRLNMKVDEKGEKRYFSGLGELIGRATIPIPFRIGTRSTQLIFYIVDKKKLPILIGMKDLLALNIDIRLQKHMLVDAATDEEVVKTMLAEEEGRQLDTLTQKPINSTDEELMEEGVKMLQQKTEHLDPIWAEKVVKLFIEFQEVWVRPRAAQANKHTAKFEVTGPPIKMKMRPLAPELLKELYKQIDAMLENGVISPSKSEWGGVPVFVRKKDGGWRLCLDYRELNKRMTPDIYPIPLLWQQVQRAAGHKFYTTLDLNWGFWNLPLHPSSRKYTALVTPRGLYEFNIVPFGIRNSPSEFQRMMDFTFEPLQHKTVTWYIDDIIIYSNTAETMLQLLREVLNIMQQSGLYIKLQKTTLMTDHALALGHIVNQYGLRPNPAKIQGIRDAKLPTNIREVRGFLGSINFLRKYIPHCAELQESLIQLTRKGEPFVMTEKRINDFHVLKECIADSAILAAPQGSDGFTIMCDASETGLGAVLFQKQNGADLPLEYASKALSQAERNWPAYEREAYAIRWSVNKFEDYVKINGATILTDHQSLKWLMDAKAGKVRRWALYLQQFPLCIKHIKGTNNVIADWLSRSLPEEDPFNDEEEVRLPSYALNDETAAAAKQTAEQHMMSHNTIIPFVPSYSQIKQATAEEAQVTNLDKTTYEGDDALRYSIRTNKIYIPPSLVIHFIYWMHASRYGGHAGINRTTNRLKKWVWWPRMKHTVQQFIDGCLLCKRHKHIQSPITVKGVLSKPEPLELISLDCAGPRSWWGKQVYYLCIIDHCSRFIMLQSTETAPTSGTIIQFMKQRWLPVFQTPLAVLTDRGTEFTSSTFKDFVNKELGCAMIHTSAYYPQGNAINESSHRNINHMITLLEKDFQLTFEDSLQLAASIHNSAPHRSTSNTPFFMLFGFEPTLPGWQGIQQQPKDAETRNLIRKQEKAKVLYRGLLEQQSDGKLTKLTEFQIGDWIVYQLSDYEKASEGDTSKFAANWSLPAKIKQIKEGAVVVQTWQDSEVQVPNSKVYKLQGDVHPLLQQLNMKQLNYTLPYKAPPPTKTDDLPLKWNEHLEQTKEALPPTKNARPRKRKRLNAEEE